MTNTLEFGNALKKNGYDFFSGVPCSFLKYLINYSINECEFYMAPNEGEATAIASGAHFANRKGVVMMQNSGLGNAVSPLTSLNYVFRIPILGFVSLRGEPGLKDEPQHELMGTETTNLLDIMQIEWEYLSDNTNKAIKQIETANRAIENNKTFFFVVKKNTFDKIDLINKSLSFNNKKAVIFDDKETDQNPSRLSVLETLNNHRNKSTVFMATTGKTGRELYEVDDNKNNLYMVGSMGCISSLAMGLALTKKEKNIVAIDGDGAFLMRMGSITTITQYNPNNLLHILLDNNSNDSTGGQYTVSKNVDFIELAKSCGYKKVIYCHNLDSLSKYFNEWQENKGLTFLYIKISKGSKKNLGRPSVKPYEIKDRLIKNIN